MASDNKTFLADLSSGNEIVGRLMAGEQGAALLRAAAECGLLSAASRWRTEAELTAATGIPADFTAAACTALHAMEIFDQDGERFCLAAGIRALVSPDAPQMLASTLAISETYANQLRQVLRQGSGAIEPSPEQGLAVSNGIWGLPTSSVAMASFTAADRKMPEVRELWIRGARHMEMGCGSGRDLLRVAVSYPATSVLGIDINPLVLEEVRRQASDLGIQDRVEVRLCDARDVKDDATFDTILWSQMFFVPAARPGTIAVIRKALKPGGYLITPITGYQPRTGEARRTLAGRQASFVILLRQSWGLPWFGEEEVRAELEAEGFRFIRAVPHERTDLLLVRLCDGA